MKTSGIANVCQLKTEPVCDFTDGWVMSCFTAVTPPCFNEFSAKKGECGPDIISVNNGAYTSFCIQWSGNEHWAADVEQGLPVVWRLGNATSRGPNCTQLMTHLKGMMNPFQNTKKVTQPSLYLDMHHLDKPTPPIHWPRSLSRTLVSGGVIYQDTPSDSPLVHRPGYILRGGPMKFQLKWGMWVH